METEGVIQKLEELVSSSTHLPGTRRSLIEADGVKSIVGELRNSLPNDLLEAREIIRQRESIFNLANLEAQRIRDGAEEYARSTRASAEEESRARINESEIVKQAEAQAATAQEEAKRAAQQTLEDVHKSAQRILDEAESTATNRRNGADQYAREVLFNLEERISDQLSQVRKGIDALGQEIAPLHAVSS